MNTLETGGRVLVVAIISSTQLFVQGKGSGLGCTCSGFASSIIAALLLMLKSGFTLKIEPSCSWKQRLQAVSPSG